MGFRCASQFFCHALFLAQFAPGLDPHAIYHCKQLHADTHLPRACAHSCIHKVRLTLKTWPSVRTHQCQQRASQDSRTDPQSAAPPPAWLLPACPHQSSANRRVNIATSCRGVDANRHQAQSGHTGTTVCFCSLLNTLLFSLFCLYSNWNLNIKCWCVCVHAYMEQCQCVDPGHSRMVTRQWYTLLTFHFFLLWPVLTPFLESLHLTKALLFLY